MTELDKVKIILEGLENKINEAKGSQKRNPYDWEIRKELRQSIIATILSWQEKYYKESIELRPLIISVLESLAGDYGSTQSYNKHLG